VNSPLGNIVIQGNQTHIQYLKFVQAGIDKKSDSLQLPDWSNSCRKQLEQYFLAEHLSKEGFEFSLPIDPQGTEFQQRVWQALGDVKYGVFASYQQLALKIGNANSVRAVASANARNPIWLIIPCHRIIGSDNALRGYAGGIERKAKLLQLENHQLDLSRSTLINEKTKILS
jgi:methylated-DNA-[protein]-cysteine S-methyltransferase